MGRGVRCSHSHQAIPKPWYTTFWVSATRTKKNPAKQPKKPYQPWLITAVYTFVNRFGKAKYIVQTNILLYTWIPNTPPPHTHTQHTHWNQTQIKIANKINFWNFCVSKIYNMTVVVTLVPPQHQVDILLSFYSLVYFTKTVVSYMVDLFSTWN